MQAATAAVCARSLSLPWSPPQVSQLGRLGLISSLAAPRRQELHAQYRKAPRLSRCSVAVALGCGKAEGTGVENWDRGGGLVHKLAHVDPSVVVEVGALVQAHARVGPNAHIGSGSIVGRDVTIGSSTVLGYNVSLQNCSIGESCILHNGVCVGQDGFGFLVNEEGEVVKKPQLLQVKIGNHVEIGANSCVDRGSWRDTVIGDHTKIDNLVQIGHNAVIGRCCMLCGQVGIGGSATLGDYVVMGGQSGVADHRTIVSKVRIAAKSGVTNNILESGDYGGMPAIKATEFRRALVAFKRLGREPTTSRVSASEDAPVD